MDGQAPAQPSGGQVTSPGSGGGGDAGLTTPQPGKVAIGGNGGPDTSDWRAMLAGEDAKALERLARYKSPADVGKALIEAQTKLSQRSEAPKLSDQSTPEQIAEYRKAFDVPEVPKDAKDEAYAEAYGLKLPEGVDLPPAMLGAFAKSMNAKHVPKSVVQTVIGEYAAIQKGIAAQAERQIVEKRKEWQNSLRDEVGSKEYDGRRAAASAWLQQQFDGRENDLNAILTAQLPGGGLLGDHPFFFNLIAEKAMGAGFTDRIEGAAMESTGKSLGQQQQEIEALMFKDKAAYEAAAAPGGRLEKIIQLRVSRGELDENGNEVRRRRTA